MTKPINPYIDFTLLDEGAPLDKYRELCRTAIGRPDIVRAVCVPPVESIVKLCLKETKDSNVFVCCVNDFPFGDGGEERKLREFDLSYGLGVREVDTVINLKALKNHDRAQAAYELRSLCHHKEDARVKVILETAHKWYSSQMISEISRLAVNAGAWCLKISTGKKDINTPAGFLPKISLEDKIQHALWMHEAAPDAMIKVAGGITCLQDVRDICGVIDSEKVIVGTSTPIWHYGMPD